MNKDFAHSTIFLTVEQVLKIHEMQLKAFGGSEGIRDYAGLASAIEQPKSTYGGDDLYPSVFDKAAVYAFHISQAQAFVDGNKRTGLHACLTFLAVNDKPLPECAELEDWMNSFATKEKTKDEFSDFLRDLFIKSFTGN